MGLNPGHAESNSRPGKRPLPARSAQKKGLGFTVIWTPLQKKQRDREPQVPFERVD